LSTPVGVRGALWRAAVTPWGDVMVNDQSRLSWYIAADDRWYKPARETTVRQRLISDLPIIETRVKVPSGDVVQRVYGVANLGGLVVVEIYNDSSLPIAVAFDRGDIATMRAPSPTGVQGIDLPPGSVVFPVGHHATIRVAIQVCDLTTSPTTIDLDALPGAEQVERGWTHALQSTSRIDVPELSWSSLLTSQRCGILLSQPIANHRNRDDVDDVEFVLDLAERVRLGDKAEQWASDVAFATERIIERCSLNKIVEWDDERALLSASMLLNRAGERRGREDIAKVWARLAEPRVAREMPIRPETPVTSARVIAWIESQLATLRRDGSVDICPRGIDKSWLGVNFECFKLIATHEHSVSFAVRWHGERPALLWEIDGPPGVRVVSSALDSSFSSTDKSGETLLQSFAK